MFLLALLIGLYAYLIFLLGLLFLLKPFYIIIFTLVFTLLTYRMYVNKLSLRRKILKLRKIKLSRFEKTIFLIIFAQAIVNLVGALGPELSFDALWYHLTLPKIYLLSHAVVYVPGGLLYYSTIPKLTELLYTSALIFGSQVPKIIHFGFGLLTCFALFKISRKYLSFTLSLLVVLLFYSNLSVAWESITAYVDLARSFFEVMALWAFLNWMENKKHESFYLSAVMLGLAISSKLVSLITIPIYIFLIFIQKLSNTAKIELSIKYVLISLFIVSPWFVFSFIHTHNPIYPLITNYETHQGLFLLNPINFFKSLFLLLTHAPDPISPFYIIIFPLIIVYFSKLIKSYKPIFIFVILSIFAWYFTPLSGGGRFIIPFLPIFSILAVVVVYLLKDKLLKSYVIFILLFLASISVVYRGLANYKYLPVLLGMQKREDFMAKNLNFSYGDFYDTDNYFKNHLKKSDTVLLYGFHNLFYVDFNFIDSSWVKKGDAFNYIATQNSGLPDRFSFWRQVYYNPKTKVILYWVGGTKWIY